MLGTATEDHSKNCHGRSFSFFITRCCWFSVGCTTWWCHGRCFVQPLPAILSVGVFSGATRLHQPKADPISSQLHYTSASGTNYYSNYLKLFDVYVVAAGCCGSRFLPGVGLMTSIEISKFHSAQVKLDATLILGLLGVPGRGMKEPHCFPKKLPDEIGRKTSRSTAVCAKAGSEDTWRHFGSLKRLNQQVQRPQLVQRYVRSCTVLSRAESSGTGSRICHPYRPYQVIRWTSHVESKTHGVNSLMAIMICDH